MLTRRTFLGTIGGALASAPLAFATQQSPRKRMAIVTTEWRYHSHAWHMGERFLAGYPIEGRWHHPPFEVVSAYLDQKPEGDLSRGRAKEFGFTIYPTIAEALRSGGPAEVNTLLDKLLAGKPKGHDFHIAAERPAVARHMSVTGG